MEKKRPLLSIRPHFDPGLTMVQSLIVTALGFLVVTVAAGFLTYILFALVGLDRYFGLFGVFGFYMVVSIAGLPPLFYELKKRAFQRTLYNFYEDYMDFQYFHWYLNRRRGRVWYRDIADVTQHASALEEHQRLTTIYLYVPNMAGGNGQRGFAGLKLEDLQQSKGYLTKVMDVLEMGYTGVLPVWARGAGQPEPPRPMFAEAAPPPGGFAISPEAYAQESDPAAPAQTVQKP